MISVNNCVLCCSNSSVTASTCCLTSSYLPINLVIGVAIPNNLAKKPCFTFGFMPSTSKPLIEATREFSESPAVPNSLFLTPSSILSLTLLRFSCALAPKKITLCGSLTLISFETNSIFVWSIWLEES